MKLIKYAEKFKIDTNPEIVIGRSNDLSKDMYYLLFSI